MVTALIVLGIGTSVAALILTLLGSAALIMQARAGQAPAGILTNTLPTITLIGKGSYPAEPGVLLNTLWEHLPNAECQAGECGGCKLRLLEGEVRWIREPVAEVDRASHVLACSCEARGSVRCALN